MTPASKPKRTPSMTVYRWEKLIQRWATVEKSPEVALIAAVIANAIEDERCRFIDGPKYETGFFDTRNGFFVYCKAIGINAGFLKKQIQVAADYEAYRRGR